jgi:hypothetical protein
MANGMQPGMQPGGMPGGQVPSPEQVVGAITQRLQELEAEKAQLITALHDIQGQGMPQQMAGPPQGPPQGMQGGLLA